MLRGSSVAVILIHADAFIAFSIPEQGLDDTVDLATDLLDRGL